MAYAQDAAIQKLIALIKDALSDKQDKPDSGNYLTDIDVNIEQTGTGAILTVNGQSVTLSNGQNGFSPTIRIINNNNGTTVVITDVTGTQSFDIMDGTDGADGQNGQDGFSPLVTVTKSGYDITLSITDENGTTTETFVDGSIAYSAFPSSLATGNPATFTDSVQNIPVDKLMVEILPNQPAGLSPGGNDDPTPTNIRPISGYNGDTITVTGDNDSDTYTIDWSNKSIVGTTGVLYGGTLDVTTGTLSVKWRSINIAGSNSYTYGSGYVQFSLSSSYRALYSAVPKFLSNQYKIFDNVQSTSYDHICVILNDNDVVVGMRIYDSRFTDATTTKALLNSHPVQICYVLLVVRTVQLTATQITLFLGNNSISSLDGVVSVIYRMNDTSSYLNAFKSMIAGVEISYVATQNYATGDLVIVDNTLLHITDNIANGSDIIPGTNCEQTTVEQVIASSIIVNSVNGKTGAVVLDAEDVGAVDVNNLPLNLGENLEFVKNGINATTGDTYNSTTVYHTDYVDVSGFSTIVYTRLSTSNASSTYCSVAFYDANNVFVSSIRPIYNSVAGVMLERANIPSGVVYARFCMFESNMTSFRLYDGAQYGRALKLMGIAEAGAIILNTSPSIGDSVVYTENGWVAQRIGASNINDGSITEDKLSSELITKVNRGGMSNDAKTALLALLEKVAYIDGNGQDYYDTLEAALLDRTLLSISATFTQGSNVIYDTDALDSLKQYLVVTANYDDSTSAEISDYTLSGSLTAGTSTITVSYDGKTTTFNVTVTAVLYPITNGTHEFTATNYAGRTIAVSNNNHVTYYNQNSTSSTSGTVGSYAIFDAIASNSASANTTNINSPSTTLFTIPANASVRMEISNIVYDGKGGTDSVTKFAIALRSGSTSIVTTGDLTPTDTSKTVNTTIANSTNITAGFIYAGVSITNLEFDIKLFVNGDRWI